MNDRRPKPKNETEPTAASVGLGEFDLPDAGWLLIGSGAFGVILSLLTGRRGFLNLAVPLSLIGLGSGIVLKERQTHMGAAEEKIRAELRQLDPVARAQVLKEVARKELGLDSSD